MDPTASPAVLDLTPVTSIWDIGKTMIGDVIEVVSTHPLLVVTLIAIPLVGLGISLFKRLVR